MPNSPDFQRQLIAIGTQARQRINEGIIRSYLELWEPLFQLQGYRLKAGWEKRQDLAISNWCHLVLERIDDPAFCFSVDFNLIYGERLHCGRGVFGKPHGGDCRVKGEFTDFFHAIEIRYQKWVKAGRPVNVTYND